PPVQIPLFPHIHLPDTASRSHSCGHTWSASSIPQPPTLAWIWRSVKSALARTPPSPEKPLRVREFARIVASLFLPLSANRECDSIHRPMIELSPAITLLPWENLPSSGNSNRWRPPGYEDRHCD